MKKLIDAIIFDLDNTLVATDGLQEYRINGDKQGLQENLGKSYLYTPVLEILREIKCRNIPLALVTNSPRWYTQALLIYHEINIFDVLVCYDDVGPEGKKPQPNGLNLALNKLGLSEKNNTFYIGDQGSDFVASYRANIKPVAPSWASREPMDTIPAAIISSRTLIDNLDDFDEISLAADRTATKGDFKYPMKQLNFLPIDDAGNLTALNKEDVKIISLGRYFSKSSNSSNIMHSNHALSQELARKDSSDKYVVPEYFIDLLVKAIDSLEKYSLSSGERFDIITVVPAKKGKNKRLENMLKRISNRSGRVEGFITDLFDFNEGSLSLKTLGGKAPRVRELDKNLHLKPKFMDVIRDKKILIIDDITTTAATFNRCFSLLEGRGVLKVMGLCMAKTVSISDFEVKICPDCGRVMNVCTNKKNNIAFYACTGFREDRSCEKTEDIRIKDCSVCGAAMVKKMNKTNGSIFLSCTGYYTGTCKNTESL